MPLFDVDETGVVVPDLPQAIIDMLVRFAEAFGTDLATDPQTPQAQLAGIAGLTATEIGEAIQSAVNGVSPFTGQGAQLDTLGTMPVIERRLATRSEVDATLTGVAGTNVPAGSRARSTAGDEFETVADVVLAAGGVTAAMRAVNTGPVATDAGTLTEIVTLIAGWESITNPTAGSVGRAAETDAEYRTALIARARRTAVGPVEAVRAVLDDLGVGRYYAADNPADLPATAQQWTTRPHGLLVIAEHGTAADVTRAIETHRGMGTPTMCGIIGDTPAAASVFTAITDGTVTFDGTAYTGLDLSATTTAAERAAALTTLLDGTGVNVVHMDGVFVAQFGWHPDRAQTFADAAVEQAFGLDEANATAPPGPFLRPRARPLTVTMSVTRQPGFPSDGLDRIRDALTARVAAYDLGATVYLNDLLAVAQNVPGSQVTAITVQHDSADVNGTAPPLDALWTLPTANLAITIT